ncbi:DUF3102 domain-containing protein [Bacillus bingmayongensis]|uniref:DUF3102 domain-containing protein n=1 Tax=Bacillus bingmayongensis TaxID=1150157 RepID=UPI001C8E6A68|nr:DUF3102 domain-containing protein [Bacillus bingmayongensis]MBY0597359.1 DUF3102 domain-containing protein [Bacillus bingmayongensis]
MTNSLVELSNDINVITAEINAYQRVAGEAIFEIGRRLKHVKEKKIAEKRGGWTEWILEVGLSTSQADRFIKVVSELENGKLPTSGSISLGKLYEIALLPVEEREKPQVIPSTGEEKKPEDMTVRELREVKKVLRQAEEDKRKLGQLLTEERNKPKEVEYVRDSGIESELQRYKEMFGDISVYEEDYKFVGSSSKASAAIQRFIHKQRKLIEEFAFLRNYSSTIDKIPWTVRDDYVLILQAMNDFVVDIATTAGFTEEENETDDSVIDVEYEEVH